MRLSDRSDIRKNGLIVQEAVATSSTCRCIAIIGGGAAGFFAALSAAEADPGARIRIYERGRQWLTKVRISGGGRCNVTHACFDPARMAGHYPRGSRELRAAFHHWQPQDTIRWFAERGVPLKEEADGRMFPVTDDSGTIIDCFLRTARTARVELLPGVGLKSLSAGVGGGLVLERSDGLKDRADAVCFAVGSLKASPLVRSLELLGHTVQPLAPSLFAFNVADKRTSGLAGVSVENASVRVIDEVPPGDSAARSGKAGSGSQSGPLLITHRGFSGPAILKLSAWEARRLQERKYHFEISVNWCGDQTETKWKNRFADWRKSSGGRRVKNTPPEFLPRRLWERLTVAAGVGEATTWAQLPKEAENALVRELTDGRYAIRGKTTNKEEFVTCGGVHLREVDFRTMESRILPGLHFAGECLDFDGITGGFNFQAAWTTGRLAGLAMGRHRPLQDGFGNA